ncbi:hypothetical protein [Geoalkalibacter halelectricus]|uniref:ATP-grasp domain-containing protein n=1 Tax=Geoalkalibacter halelectricus TaxID=2847045 RepID=A0ABY5ZPY9_9BACT|nr:hypothetical protein [Geoalkalibacter halelectricus]MDO3379748.1 hypothetical protein [Geoalkalibacter halelectricus]UWZ79281.1 hypothetical protein L9S41_16600 [Geoalkalibacter halelectricus]
MLKLNLVLISQFGPPSLASIRSWGRRGARVGLIQIVSAGEPVPRSRYLADHIAVTADEFMSGDGFARALTFIRDFNADLLLTISEQFACLLDENRHLLPDNMQLMFSGAETTRAILSKSRQIAMAGKLGMKLLPTWEIGGRDFDWSQISPKDFPLCLRPSKPGGIRPSFKVRIVRSAEELDAFIKTIEQFNSPVLAQPFTNVPNLVVHGARGPDGTACGVEGFLVERKFEGVTLTIRPFAISDELRRQCMAFVEEFGVIGPYHFEFLYDPETQTPWFLELNSRLGGTTAKVLACGYDEPAWALKAFGYDVDPGRTRNGVTASSKKAIGKFLLGALKGKLTPLDYPDEPRWKRVVMALYGFAAWRDDVFAWDDLPAAMALYGLTFDGKKQAEKVRT